MSLVENCSRISPGVLSLLAAVALLACLPATAHAQVTLVVSGTSDPSPVPFCGGTRTGQTVGSVSCPSLRAAIRHANTNGNSGTDTIVLQGGSVYTLSIRGPNEDDAQTGDLDIRSDLNVRITASATALGSTAIVRGGPGWDDRIFDVNAGGSGLVLIGFGLVQIENLSIQGGQAGAQDVFAGNGGGIRNLGTLTLTNCTVEGNRTISGDGGGIDNPGKLTLINSTVVGNSAVRTGGGIVNSGELILTSSTISKNFAHDGGGIFNIMGFFRSKATLTNSTISDNIASGSGGGIWNQADGRMELTGTTVRSNIAQGLLFDVGGGIVNLGRLTVTNSTISSNVNNGILNSVSGLSAELRLTNSTVSSNIGAGILDSAISPSPPTNLRNATIALNTGPGVRSLNAGVGLSNTILADECEGSFFSLDLGGHNLFQFPTCTIRGGSHDQFGVNPLLGGLRFNGGQTQTHLPAAGSPAIDNGNPVVGVGSGFFGECPSTDQLGRTRPLDGDGIDPDGSGPIPPAVCDIGAVEQWPPLITTGITCCLTVATTLGVLDLTPTEATVPVGQRFAYAFEWTVPQGGWRSLDTLEFRLVDGGEVILWVRFAEAADPPDRLGTFSLVHEKNGPEGPRFAPGSHNRLETEAATVYLDGSAAHGPPGSTVGLTLELSFKPQAGGRSYAVEVLATDDAGAATGFVRAGTLTVLPRKR